MRIKYLIITLIAIKVIVLTLFMHYVKPFRKNADVVLRTIHERSSVREYSTEIVSEQMVETILKAAMAAPSARNVQPWLFYVITRRSTLDSLTNELPYAKMLATASLAIVVAGDTQKGNPNPEQALNWVMDCSAATQNLLLAVQALGLGAVWTGVYPYQDRIRVVSDILGLPPHIIPLNVIPIGHPIKAGEPKEKWDTDKIIRVY